MTTPTYYNARTPVLGRDGKTRFPKVGVAYPQREGSKSVMKIILHAIPINGEIILFAPKLGSKEDDDVPEDDEIPH